MTREHKAWLLLMKRITYLNSFEGDRSLYEKPTKLIREVWDSVKGDPLPDDSRIRRAKEIREKAAAYDRMNSHCDIGTHEHEVAVDCPKWLYPGCPSRTRVYIDRCIVDEIKYLWSKGIRTYGSCCGHGKLVPMVNVHDDDIGKMLEMNYIGGINKHGAATFALKSLNGWEEK